MLDIFVRDILGTPSILIGIFVFIGLLLLKKPFTNILTGTIKTIMGFILLGAGAGIISGTLTIFNKMFTQAFGLQGVVTNTDAMGALTNEKYSTAAFILIFGMAVNLLIAKFTRFKYIYLTGHLTMYMSGMLAMIFSGVTPWLAVVIGAIILGAYMAIGPALIQKNTILITDSDDFAIGHSGTVSYLLASKLGGIIGNKSKSTEDINVPKGLSFLRDSSIAISLTMTILFVIVGFFAGPAYIETELSSGQFFVVFSLIKGITFAAGVYVVLAGVRMALTEIVPAFQGIADKVIVGAKPALDCPIVFPFAPNAVIIGFISSFLAGLLGMLLLSFSKLPVIVPGMTPHFFTGATAAIYGNSTGGRRGAIAGAVMNGLLISILPAVFMAVVGGLSNNMTFGDPDFTVVGLFSDFIAKLLN